jgi:hypothetical protein
MALLAQELQKRSGIQPVVPMRYWIGGMLGLVADRYISAGEPTLTSLCKRQSGLVGNE